MNIIPKPLLAVLILISVVFGASYLWDTNFFGLVPYSYEQYAEKVIAACAKENYPPSCYDNEIPKLMDRGLSMEETFEVTSIIQGKVNNYFYCHVLGHRLSEKETAKDPLKWTEVVARCPTGMCSNGCLHGAAQERFRNDVLTPEQVQSLLPELTQVCEEGYGRAFTGLEQASCYHSLGHLSMYITGADADASVAVCDDIAQKGDNDYRKTCYEGAYMQIFQPLEPEDFALVKDIPATTTVSAHAYCGQFTGEKRDACNRESWPLYRASFDAPSGLEAFCSLASANADSKRYCYNAMFYVLTAQYNFDKDKITQLCEGVPQERKGQCFANAASRLIETDYRLIPDALEMCKRADTDGVGPRCYDELLYYSAFNFHQGSDAFNALCKALPEPWSGKCFAGEGYKTILYRDDVIAPQEAPPSVF